MGLRGASAFCLPRLLLTLMAARVNFLLCQVAGAARLSGLRRSLSRGKAVSPARAALLCPCRR